MAEFRRGFKTWCENIAYGFRRDLNLPKHGALSPDALAEHLNITVWTPDELPGLKKEHRDQLLIHDEGSWSAVTLSLPEGRFIVVNSARGSARRNNDLMHEIAHVVLEHEPAQMVMSANGHMFLDSYSTEQEDEADWLAAALLIPRDAALKVLAANQDVREAARFFGVSESLMKMRIARTGIDRQLKQRRRYYGQAS
ncbi:MAG: ImmA/IrrE family metallo-endopeptidase [Hyphomicrobiaceae bacterium]